MSSNSVSRQRQTETPKIANICWSSVQLALSLLAMVQKVGLSGVGKRRRVPSRTGVVRGYRVVSHFVTCFRLSNDILFISGEVNIQLYSSARFEGIWHCSMRCRV